MKRQSWIFTTAVIVSFLGTGYFAPALLPVAAASAAAYTKLGDLTVFRKLAQDTEALINKGDLDAAKARIRDLEKAWDNAEAGLKPRSAADWHIVDKSIDRALAALRARNPDLALCKKTIAEVLVEMDKAGV
jgi:hypothetical protein